MRKWKRHFTHALEQTDFFFKFQTDIPKERNALNSQALVASKN